MQIGANGHIKIRAVLLLALGAMSFLWLGCGKKGPPRPPKRPLPPAVQDLRHSVQGNVVELTWTLPNYAASDTAPPATVKVLRAVQSAEELDCDTCPLRFSAVAESRIDVAASEKTAPQTLSFKEIVAPGYRYVYKVIVFDQYGVAGKASNRVDFYHAPD